MKQVKLAQKSIENQYLNSVIDISSLLFLEFNKNVYVINWLIYL